MLIDTHAHCYASQFSADREATLDRALRAGVRYLLMPAIDGDSYEAMFQLCRAHPRRCLPMMGLHPTSVNNNPQFRAALSTVERYLQQPPEGVRFVGVGEAGLDLYWSRDYLPQQIEALRFQIELALSYDLPLVLHTRDAWEQMCQLLEEYRGRGLRGVLHSFSGEEQHYRQLSEMGGFLFGIGGPVTYKRSAISELVRHMELKHLVLETDAPYLPPVPHRAERNESAYLPLIVHRIAELRGIDPLEVARTTTANTIALFGAAHFL